MKAWRGHPWVRPQPLLFSSTCSRTHFLVQSKGLHPTPYQLALSLEGPQAVHPGIKTHSLKARCNSRFGQSEQGDLQARCGRLPRDQSALWVWPQFQALRSLQHSLRDAPWFLFT